MSRWKVIAAAAALIAGVSEAKAQLPNPGSTGIKYSVVGPSTSPLSAPIPSVAGPAGKKPSFFGRFYETLAKYLPFVPAKKPTIAPQLPTTAKLPNQGPGIQIQQTGGGIPTPPTPQPIR
jgi:hypothetical protein